MRKSVRSLALLSAVALAAGTGFSGSATAAPAEGGTPEILARGLAGPLSTAAAADGTAYVTANFGGQLWKVPPGGSAELVYQATEKGAEVGGVSVQGARVVFTITGKAKKVLEINGGGPATTIANVGKYERINNPDRVKRYGFKGLSARCQAQLPKNQQLEPYAGHVDSHPYATEQVGGVTYVADAAGNDILVIAANGTVGTVGVLPATKIRATRAKVRATGLPACVTGHLMRLESVPTDVELGPDGWLYISSLPGGPEDGSLGRIGRVYKMNPATGRVVRVAKGFVSTVNLAVAPDGDVYVSELFTGRIVRVPAGTSRKRLFAQVSMPAGLEYAPTGLYATVDALKGTRVPRGKLALIPFAP